MTELERYTFNDGRVYTDGDVWLPSVSFVLDQREEPAALTNYKKNTSQAKQDEKKFYTQNRGTLIHYALLSILDADLEWTDDEQSSLEELRGEKVNEETGLTGDYETWQQFEEDKEWVLRSWKLIRRVNDINSDSTKNVELFVKNTDVGYAGQFDLLYMDDGEYVLADIKTSKRVYDKHLLQLVAYEHAVDVSVDRLEVIRIHPDTMTWEVSRSDEWMEDRDDLWDEFRALRKKLGDEKIDELKKRAQDVSA